MNIIFITYINRSGSTYLANLFSKFDEVLVCPEAEVLINKFLINPDKKYDFNSEEQNNVSNILENDNKFKHWGITISDLESLNGVKTNFDAFIHILYVYMQKIKPKATTIVFKGNLLINLFYKITSASNNRQDINFISIYRDIRAVYNSQKHTFGSNNKILSYNPIQTTIEWIKHINTIENLLHNNNFYSIKYENFIINTEIVLAELLIKLNININSYNKDGDLFSRIPNHQKKMHSNINNIPDTSKINAWQANLSTKDIYIIQKKAEKVLLKYDYKILKIKINLLSYLVSYIYYYTDYFLKLFYKKALNAFK